MPTDIITDRLQNMTDNLTKGIQSIQDNLSFPHIMERGLINMGFAPYQIILGDFFLGILIGGIGIGLYSWKSNIYYLIGYLVAVLLVVRAVLPGSFADMFTIITGLAVTGVLYYVFVKKKSDTKGNKPQPPKAKGSGGKRI
jgi:mannose/fructose/N-acetylgalactosamine-specific phosphotransferase system component IIC